MYRSCLVTVSYNLVKFSVHLQLRFCPRPQSQNIIKLWLFTEKRHAPTMMTMILMLVAAWSEQLGIFYRAVPGSPGSS